MKTILTIILISILNLGFSQTKVKFTFVDSCKEKLDEDYDISMISLDEEVNEYWIKGKSMVNIKNGIYLITVNVGEGDYFRTFSFTKKFELDSIYNVSRQLPSIMKKFTIGIHEQEDLGFYNCDEICNGKLEEFYGNGKIRMEGEFRKGLPIKQIKKYNDKGELVEIQIYNKSGIYKKSKYPDYNYYVETN